MAYDSIQDSVKEYYGKVLSSSKDLKTDACCSLEDLPLAHRRILGQIEPEIIDRFYGCGSPIPTTLQGATVLDLGCGTGRDAYLASALVGEEGQVIGVDMTDEQLAVARKYLPAMTKKFGFSNSNVDFRQGYIEDLASVGIEDASVDVVISNCVVNLSPDKPRVMAEIMRVLKPGGELYFSDVFADRRIPQHLRDDETLYGECLSGAMYGEDFRRTMEKLGCPDVRTFSSRPLTVEDPELKEKVGNIVFTSKTVRAFKLQGATGPSLEDRCEDYGQVATYLGGIDEMKNAFRLDDHHIFEVGRPMLVCGNTAAMIQETRLSPFFTVTGERAVHFGLFDCSDDDCSDDATSSDDDDACC